MEWLRRYLNERAEMRTLIKSAARISQRCIDDLVVAQDEIGGMKKALASAHNKLGDADNLRASLEEQNAILDANITELRSVPNLQRYTIGMSMTGSLPEDLMEITAEDIETVTTQIREAKALADLGTTGVKVLQGELATSEGRMRALVDQARLEIKTVESTFNDKQCELEDATAKVSEIETKLETTRQTVDSLRADLCKREDEIQSLEQNIREHVDGRTQLEGKVDHLARGLAGARMDASRWRERAKTMADGLAREIQVEVKDHGDIRRRNSKAKRYSLHLDEENREREAVGFDELTRGNVLWALDRLRIPDETDENPPDDAAPVEDPG